MMFAKINARQKELVVTENRTSFVDEVVIPHDTTENVVNPL